MKIFAAVIACLGLPFLGTAAPAADKDSAPGNKVAFDIHDGNFERNDSGLKGDSSYLVFTDRAGFDKIFGIGRVMGKQNFVPKDAFDKKLVAAVIKRGHAVTEYKVDAVTADDGTLYLQYTATARPTGGTATFASPLIVSVDKDHITSIVFIENGKRADKVHVGK